MPKTKLSSRNVATLNVIGADSQTDYFDSGPDSPSGFGLRVSKLGRRTFFVLGYVGARKVRSTIGELGAPIPDGGGLLWTLPLARKHAAIQLGQMRGGVSPNASDTSTAATITLREALALHLQDMKKRGCALRSLETIEYEIHKYAIKWLDAPLAELAAVALNVLHDKLTKAGTTYLANRVIAEISAIWNTVDRLYEMTGRNPASRVRRNRLSPNRERIEDSDLPEWMRKVHTLTPLRRDFQLLVLHTGLRSADARAIRWEEIDVKAATLRRPSPKGGESKAFTLPLSKIMVAMLHARRLENAELFSPYGGDHGLVFPSLTRSAPFQVQPLSQPKERRPSGKAGALEEFLPGPHVLRRTYISIGREIGIGEIDMHALANHSFSTGRVQDQYVRQSLSHLSDCQEKIAAAIAFKAKDETQQK
jgi:integrase